MNEQLLAETLGEDTTTQLYRDAEGGFHIRVMAQPEGGEAQTPPSHSPQIFQDKPVPEETAKLLFNAPAAKRYVEAGSIFAS